MVKRNPLDLLNSNRNNREKREKVDTYKQLRLTSNEAKLINKLIKNKKASSMGEVKQILEISQKVVNLPEDSRPGGITKYQYERWLDNIAIDYIKDHIDDFSGEEKQEMEQMISDYKLTEAEKEKALKILNGEIKPEIESFKKKVYLKSRKTGFENEELDEVDRTNFSKFKERLYSDLKKGSVEISYVVKGEDVTIIQSFTHKYDEKDLIIERDGRETKYYLKKKVDAIITEKDFISRMENDADLRNAIFKKYGYKDDRSLWDKFVQGLGDVFTGDLENDVTKSLRLNKENLKKLNIKDVNSIKSYLFDFNSDGTISTELRDNMSEKMLDHYVTGIKNLGGLTEIRNLLENLGFGRSLSQIKDPVFKEKFVRKLDMIVKMNVPWTVLTIKDGYRKYMKGETISLTSNFAKIKENKVSIEKATNVLSKEKLDSIFDRKLYYRKGHHLKGKDVKLLQQVLIKHKLLPEGSDDADFGIKTRNALKNYQKKVLGYKHPDGVMDYNGKTMKIVKKEISSQSVESVSNKEENGTIEKATEAVNNSSVIKNLKESFKKQIGREPNKEELQVIKKATIGFMTGFKKGIGVNVNLGKLAKDVSANLSFGIDDKGNIAIGPSVNFSKVIHDNYADLSLSRGATLTGLGADATIKTNTANKLDKHSIDVAIGIGIGVGFAGGKYKMLHASVTEKSSSNMEGFNKIMGVAKENLPIFVNRIEKGGELSKDEIMKLTGGKLDEEYVTQVQEDFKRIKELYKTAVLSLPKSQQAQAKERFEQALLVSTANRLYREQVTGFKLTGIGAFLIPGVIGGIFALGEYNYVTYDINKDARRDRLSQAVTTRGMKEVISEYPELKDALKLTNKGIKVLDPSIINVDIKNKNIIKKGNLYTTKEGFVPVFNLNMHYSADKKKNASYVVYTLTLDAIPEKVKKGSQLLEVNNLGVKNEKLDKFYTDLDKVTNASTRKHKFMDIVMDPNKSMDERWGAIKGMLATQKPDSFLKELKKVIEEVEKGGVNKKEKIYVVSTITQLAKKAHDVYQGDINKYNKNLDKIINLDKKRRKGFNEIFGFNTDRLADVYYSRLRAGQGHITDNMMHGAIAFDASSSLHVGDKDKKVKGVDVLYSNIQALSIDNKLLVVPLNKTETKAMLSKIKDKIDINLYKHIEKAIKNGYQFAFYKDADGFDDRIGLFKIEGQIQSNNPIYTANASTDLIEQNNESIGLAAAWTWDDSKPKVEKPNPDDDDGDSDPGEDDGGEINDESDDEPDGDGDSSDGNDDREELPVIESVPDTPTNPIEEDKGTIQVGGTTNVHGTSHEQIIDTGNDSKANVDTSGSTDTVGSSGTQELDIID